MKKLFTMTVISSFLIGAVITATSFEIKSGQSEVDSMLACHWFPICKEPDLHQQGPTESEPAIQNLLDIESLYACHWFPICKEPDQPAGSAAVA